MKWVLGLPQGTRSELVDVESGGHSFKCLRYIRAIKYEAQLVLKSSPILAEAQCALQRCTTEWGKKRDERKVDYGWTADGGATDPRMMEEGVILCETRRLRHAAKKSFWIGTNHPQGTSQSTSTPTNENGCKVQVWGFLQR